ncbi:MAG: acetyl-CoA hydrolase/transferase C-terminal domain-containing protein [Bdellovibrionota bacterium]
MSLTLDNKIKDKLIALDEAFSNLASNQTIVTAMAVSEPKLFFCNLESYANKLENLHVYCANPGERYSCFQNEALSGHLILNTMFLTSVVRKEHGHGVVHYIPQHLSQWTKHLIKKTDLDIFWGSCTPPDAHGFVNLGPSACYEAEVLRKAKKVILEINPNLPYVHGSTHIPVSWVDNFIESPHPLMVIDRPKISEKDRSIANYVAELIEDGSTLQLGIGGIPNAIGEALKNKKDLGIHTEMINDTIMDLYHCGAITGRKKTLWPDKIVGSFALGTKELYEFMNHNPIIELQPSSLVNDPTRIGRNYHMKSINTAVEIDLTGQVCSESVGHRELSGVGGASDTHVGAQNSPNGRGIIAMHSTTSDNQHSKIVFELMPGAKVSISRNDVDTVVTEYGVAQLAGESVASRIKKLVAIAHPNFRDDLLSKAKKIGYI